jgi:hypothetical protein
VHSKKSQQGVFPLQKSAIFSPALAYRVCKEILFEYPLTMPCDSFGIGGWLVN